ncbi:MAG: alpha/beta fold hydrolase [Betaproteobacteria bacterium]|nr:alpha/beta fold hydrolase [Betaproteobacteria bacterium]MDE2622149.1 alpha/beta fold hydrolase [Betaproteobacteria bacterium]
MTPLPAFRAPWWLMHRHAQTLYGALAAPTHNPPWIRERWPTPDGDFIDVDLLQGQPQAPLLTLFHGLEGSTRSRYLRALACAASACGWHVLAPNFRSCSGEMNLKARIYHAGDSEEIHWILTRGRDRHPAVPRFAAGVSLGGNMLLKWLGEQGPAASMLVHRTAAIGTPFDLRAVAEHLSRGFNRVYTRHFLSTLKPKALAKARQFPGQFDLNGTLRARTMQEFDDHFMAPIHGFADAHDYWARCSSGPWLPRIDVPTLLVNALDDPFVPHEALPGPAACSPAIVTDFPERGGHVGFVSGRFPGQLHWMPARLMAFFTAPEGASLEPSYRSECQPEIAP